MHDSLSGIEKELRRAAGSRQYGDVQRLVLAFCEAAEDQARKLPPADPRIGEIAAMTQKVLDWTRTMVQADRASLVLQLRQIPKVRRYVPAPAAVPPVMHLEG